MKRYLNLVACAFLFTIPIFYSQLTIGSPEMRFQQWSVFLVFCILLLATIIKNVWVSAFLLLSTFHYFFFPNPFSEPHLLQTIAGALIFYVFSTYRIENYRYVLLGLLGINLWMAAIQHFGGDVYTWMTWRENGMLGLPAYLGILSAMITPLICTIHPAFVILGLLGVFWSRSIFCVLAFSVAMAFYGWNLNRKATITLCAISLLALIPLCHQDNHIEQSSRRFPIWKMVASKAFRNPFFGWGMGAFDQQLIMELNKNDKRQYFQAKEVPENYPEILKRLEDISKNYGLNPFSSLLGKDPQVDRAIKNELVSLNNNGVEVYRWDSPHNHYLDIFFGYGFVGLFLLGGFIFDIFQKFKKWFSLNHYLCEKLNCYEIVALMSSFISILINSAVHFPLSTAKLLGVSLALIGMLCNRLDGRTTKSKVLLNPAEISSRQ